jgi:MarR family transcriptional regulator, organic hydroperoxide resistance regulator
MRGKKSKDDKALPVSTSIASLLRDGSDREFRRLIYSLIRFSEMIVRHRDVYGSFIGVTGPQYHMMTIIAASPDATAGEIAKTMSVSNQFVVSETAKLVAKKILEKAINEADRRSMLLNLAPKGRELLRELGPLRRESNDLMYRSLTGDRAAVLQEIMDTLIADAEIALHELDAPHRRGQKSPTALFEENSRAGTRRQ